MSNKIADFVSLLGQHRNGGVPVQTVWAVAKYVDWETKTMVATGQIDNLDYHNVLLGNGHQYKKPKVGTICLLGIIQNNAAMTFLIDAQQIEEHLLIQDQTLFKMDLNGFLMQRESSNLKDILQNLIKEVNLLNRELQKVVVSVGVTPNVPVLQQIEQRTTDINNQVSELFI